MFSWYQNSTRCYVYLSDVIAPPRTPWKDAFQKSKWFTRGWTLQELLAPSSVEFFTVDGERLGDRQTLSQAIRQATSISWRALKTTPLHLSDFSIDERLSWAAGRETKREEDAIYSLLGLFDVHMPPIYGEGKANAFDRLESEIERKLVLDSSRKRSASEAFETTLTGLEGSNSKLKQSTSDRAQEHSVVMQDWWAEAIARNMGTPRGYAKVTVLLLKWADELDELQTSNEVEELGHIFQDRFNFEIEVAELNHRSKPQRQMDRIITTFVEAHDQPRNLLIVYYTGHAIHYKNAGRLEFLPSSQPPAAGGTSTSGQINWYKTEDFLCSDEVDGDILAILDTEYASNGDVRHVSNDERDSNYKDQGTARRFQLISSRDNPAPGSESLTRALIDGLKELWERNRTSGFSTQDLHQCIEMNPIRSGISSKMWSLLPNKRHILLTPIAHSENDTCEFQQHRSRPERGYLKLGLELKDSSLDQEQIESLAKILWSSLDNQSIGLQGIDWLGFERRDKGHSRLQHLSP
ncbi:hypothetical protein J4E83_008768 [Alternaria metachromatica]|uniref:uncharacterized protein n=1 Tax=Alternaria metachromatica TaxID=283354 RepID=UPI0020C50F06|nr:uncharacterized protein J4E83_008768 [Alternaria metachromatica]KAI4609127.1 hypothetical protein J4E83_008768 [Alternaria metachromatica]